MLVPILARLLAATTPLLGLFVLGTWMFGNWRVASFGAGYVPTAPITAVLFVLLGLGVTGRQLWPDGQKARRFEIAGAILAIAVTGLEAVQARSIFPLPWDTWFQIAEGHVGTIPVGRMAPLTAAAFLLTAAAILARDRSHFLAPWAAIGGASGSLLIGAVVMAGYVTGAPLNYCGGALPMAFLTALAFVLLNGGLLLTGPAPETVQRWLSDNAAAFAGERNRIFMRRLAIITLLIAGVVVTLGLLYIRGAQGAARDRVERELDAVASLQVAQLIQWRKERLAEGRFLQRAPAVAADIAAFLSQPHDRAAEARVLGWLEPIKAGIRYESALLYDASGQLKLALADRDAGKASLPEHLPALPAGTGVVLGDFERHPDGPAIHLDILVPIFSGAAETDTEPLTPIATILLRLNPNHYVYPMIRQWPLPSRTAETLLVRREGDEVVYLNDLRHKPGAALVLRRSLDEKLLPAASATRSGLGMHAGRDYRGVDVLATTRLIPDSPWILISKIDLAEVYTPIRREAVKSGMLVTLLLLTVGLAAAFMWRQRHANYLERALAAEQEQAALAERLALVMQHANDSIFVMDERGVICEANERALITYGYSLDELRQLPPGGLRAPGETEAQPQQLELFNKPDGTVFETTHRRKDGSVFAVEISGTTFEFDKRRFKLAVLRDISQRKAHERQLERFNRLYAALSQVNQAIVHAKNREVLLEEICRVLVQHGQFRMAWIGWLDPDTKEILVAHKFGDHTGYLDDVRIYADERPEAQGPSGTALREDRIDVCDDIMNEARMAPWREAALRSGYRSSIALPVRPGGTARGVLTVYAAEPGFFAREEIALLEEAAMDVAFGVETLDREEHRRQVEVALQRAEEKYRGIFANAVEGIYQTTPDGAFLAANPAMARIFGYSSPEELIRSRRDVARDGYVDPRDREEFRRRIEREGMVTGFEYEAIRNDGTRIWVSENARAVRDETGRVIHYEGSLEDITESKRAKMRILEQLEELRRWNEATLGREDRILELKGEVNELLARAGATPRYASAGMEPCRETFAAARSRSRDIRPAGDE